MQASSPGLALPFLIMRFRWSTTAMNPKCKQKINCSRLQSCTRIWTLREFYSPSMCVLTIWLWFLFIRWYKLKRTLCFTEKGCCSVVFAEFSPQGKFLCFCTDCSLILSLTFTIFFLFLACTTVCLDVCSIYHVINLVPLFHYRSLHDFPSTLLKSRRRNNKGSLRNEIIFVGT